MARDDRHPTDAELAVLRRLWQRGTATVRELLVTSDIDLEWSDGNKNLYPEHIDTVEVDRSGEVIASNRRVGDRRMSASYAASTTAASPSTATPRCWEASMTRRTASTHWPTGTGRPASSFITSISPDSRCRHLGTRNIRSTSTTWWTLPPRCAGRVADAKSPATCSTPSWVKWTSG